MTSASHPVASHFDDAKQQETAAKLGMWVFLATEVLFFGVLFMGYTASRFMHPGGFAAGGAETDIVIGTVNSAILITSSFSMVLAVRAAETGGRRRLIGWLILTLVLGMVFLVLKGVEYHEDYSNGVVPGLRFTYAGPDARGVEVFFFLYFVMTGLHAVHLTIGIGVLTTLAVLSRRGRFSPAYHTPVTLAGLYWHFIDIVWIFLYPLLYLPGRA